MKRLLALFVAAGMLVGATSGSQVCADYLFAGRPAPDVSSGFYVERIVCLTHDDRLEPIYQPIDITVIKAVNEALMMELLATQRLAESRLTQINEMIAAGNGVMKFHPVVYIWEENY